ncbi:hypothetical protein GCM10010191_31010 [Actinomadura vinacea]|uniref:Uncharacterized protein n=1 Tax=Actinomadura vinacea TaxID=115336 RepID=A0ABP5W2M3_9ACTN
MARIGYSPLPPNLSQEMANSIGRMTGRSPERLSRSNCANPTLSGSLGAGAQAPGDPFDKLNGNNGPGSGTSTSAGPSAGAGASSGASAGAGTGGTGTTGAGANDGQSRGVSPVGFNGPALPGPGVLPALVLLATLAVPPAVIAFVRRRS